MKNFEKITKKLFTFVNITLPKSGWETIIKGLGLPKSNVFWQFFRDICLMPSGDMYMLVVPESIITVYYKYCEKNRACVQKSYKKKKAKAKAKAVVLPHLVVEPHSGRIITYAYAIESRQ